VAAGFSGVEAVCFDLDGTLVDALHGWRSAFAEVWPGLVTLAPALAELGTSDAVYDARLRGYMRDAHRAAGDGEWDYAYVRAAFRRLLEQHGGRSGPEGEALAERYIERSPLLARIYPDVDTTLDCLASRVPLAVVSNGLSRDQRAKLEALGLAGRFDSVVISEEVGLLKPDPAIFRRALEALDTPAEAAVYVGDNQAHDVAGAKAAGMRAIWLDRGDGFYAETHEPDAVVQDLRELPGLLGLGALRP
jgi:putative hydrolase of the HAD superfamily